MPRFLGEVSNFAKLCHMGIRKVISSESYKGFTIRKVEESGVVKYVADSGRRFDTRKRIRCDTKEEATFLCSEWKLVLDNEGREAWDLSKDQREDAAKALKRMKDLGMDGLDLLEVVERFHVLMPKKDDLTLDQLREGFILDFERRLKKGKSRRTFQSYSYKTQLLVDTFPDQFARYLDGEMVLSALFDLEKERGWSSGSFDSYVSVWKVFFSYCVAEEQMDSCPLSKKSIASKIKKHTEKGPLPPPVIPSIEDTRKLLREAWRTRDKGMLQAITVLVFGGLRPNAEMLSFEWRDYDPQGFLNVGGDRSKNESSARRVEICPVAVEWLDYAKAYLNLLRRKHEAALAEIIEKQKVGPLSDDDRKRKRDLRLNEPLLVTTLKDEHGAEIVALRFKPNDWSRNWTRLRNSAGIENWVEDSTRHGWASYSFGDHGDSDRLRRQLGHCDKRMLNHYLHVSESVRKKAKRYISLGPKEVLSPAEYKVFEEELNSFKESEAKR